MAKKHTSRVTECLARCPGQAATPRQIYEKIDSHTPGVRRLTPAEVDRAIEILLKRNPHNPQGAVPVVTRSHGGRLIYWGTERYSTVALYDAVGHTFCNQWGPKMLRLQTGTDPNVSPLPKRPPRTAGDWTSPDLVVFARPVKRRSIKDPRDTHCFEIEQRNGFTIASVYQAYEQGRGANFTWVFAHAEGTSTQIRTAAKELGVGVVTFRNPKSVVTYDKRRAKEPEFIPARRREVSPSERAAFLGRITVADPG